MEVMIFTRRDQPGRHVLDRFLSHLDRLRIRSNEVDADSPNGISKAELYDILNFPALLVTRADGTMVQVWQGELPKPEDVSTAYHQ